MLDALTNGGESLPVSAGIFLVAAVVVWRAGTRLAGYADRFASATGLSGAVVGLLVLGGVTSLPEVATSATAALSGAASLAVNNLIGGVSLQLAVLAVIDIAIGRQALSSQVPRLDVLAFAAMNVVLLAVVAGAVAAGDVALFGSWIGVGPVLVLLAYGGCLLAAREVGRGATWRPVGPEGRLAVVDDEDGEWSEESPARLGWLIAASGAVILVAGIC